MAKAKRAGSAGARKAPRRKCGTMQVHHWLLEDDPNFRQRQVELEHSVSSRARTSQAKLTKPYRVRVVVHVVYRTAAENISAAQVKSQIKVLNRDFRAKNADKSKVPTPFAGLVADPMIQFELAKLDPKGKPTTGIVRVATTKTEFEDDDGVKSSAKGGADAWPTDRYLNIWVCTLGGGLLGYAQFPGGPVRTDGVVILNTAFGTTGSAKAPFNKGRSTTHEIGHYFNLRHIWGDTEDCSGGDLVADTPNAETANFGKPKFPHVSCSNGPNGDMYMNYMDYVDDDSMFMFTAGQVQRMHVAIDGPRKGLVK
jgi:hypothetical protein